MKSPNLDTAPPPRSTATAPGGARAGRTAPQDGRTPSRRPGARGRSGHLPEKLSKAVGMYSVGYPFVV